MPRRDFSWQLPPAIEARLGSTTYGRQRAIFEEDHLLLILNLPPRAEDVHREAMVFLRKPDGQLLCNGNEGGEIKLPKLLESYRDRYQKLDDAYDNATSAEDLFEVLESLGRLNRASTNLHNALQTARDLVPEDLRILSARDEAYEISRNFELLLADSKMALDYRIAKHTETQAAKTEEMTNAQHKLNILAAITFPLMAIATIFGMNLVHGLETAPEVFFWLVIFLGIGVGLVTKVWVTRQAPVSSKQPLKDPKKRLK
jgi:hypothetical protein